MPRTKTLNGFPKYLAKYQREQTSGELFLSKATEEQKEQFSTLPLEELLKAVRGLLENYETIKDGWFNYKAEASDLILNQPFFYGSFSKLGEILNFIIHNKIVLLRSEKLLEDFMNSQEAYKKEVHNKIKSA